MDRVRRGLESFKALYRDATHTPTLERIPEDVTNAALYALFHSQAARSRYGEWEDRREDLEYLDQGKSPPHGYPLKGMTPEDFRPILQAALPLIESRIRDRLQLADEWFGKYDQWKKEFDEDALEESEARIRAEREKLLPMYRRQPLWFEDLNYLHQILE